MRLFSKVIILSFILYINTQAQWVKPMGAVASYARSVATDTENNVFVTGHFEDRIQMDETTILTNLGYLTQDVFIGKFDPEGNLLWAHNIGGLESDVGLSIVTDLNGNCFITGSYYGPASFDSSTVLDESGTFIAKYNSGGKLLWANKISSSVARGTDLATNSNGEIIGIDVFYDTAKFNEQTIFTSKGGEDAYFFKYNSDGVFQWARQISSEQTLAGNAIDIDSNNNILIAGNFLGIAHFDSSTTLSGSNGTSYFDAFIAKYNSNGDLQWAKRGGGKCNGNGISTDGNNDILLTGSFADTINIDSTTSLISSGYSDIFVLKYSPSGSLKWAKYAGADGSIASGQNITADANENIFITGNFYPSANFDGFTTLTSNSGIENAFFVKYNQEGDLEWANKVGTSGSFGSGVSLGYGIDTDESDNVLVAGSFHGEAEFDESTSFISLGGKADAFVAKYSSSDGSLVTNLNDNNLYTNPTNFYLEQNYPNPFNPTTTIRYNLPQSGFVKLKVFDLQGREVKTLVQENKSAGENSVLFEASNLASGLYVYRIEAGRYNATRKFLLIK